MRHAANQIAASVPYDAQILDAAAGPRLEVEINPPPGRKPRLTSAAG